MSTLSEITPKDVFDLIGPEYDTHGTWMCAGVQDDGSVYSQVIAWDGSTLKAVIENSYGKEHGDLHLFIHGEPEKGCWATKNGATMDLKEALVLFCGESVKMPAPQRLQARPGIRMSR